jgi:hypothetical protein
MLIPDVKRKRRVPVKARIQFQVEQEPGLEEG